MKKLKMKKLLHEQLSIADTKSRTEIWPIVSIFRGFDLMVPFEIKTWKLTSRNDSFWASEIKPPKLPNFKPLFWLLVVKVGLFVIKVKFDQQKWYLVRLKWKLANKNGIFGENGINLSVNFNLVPFEMKVDKNHVIS